jgi:probable rRNA maturation factor
MGSARLTVRARAIHPAAMPVRLRIEGQSDGVEEASVLTKRFATRMLSALTLQDAELSLLICDDRVMRRLNREHRHIDKPTDVLAFAMREGPSIVSMNDTLGDVVISWPTTKRQARSHGQPAERELCLLLAHGVLHLLGFDHADRVTERRMMARAHMLMAAALRPTSRVDKLRRRVAGR